MFFMEKQFFFSDENYFLPTGQMNSATVLNDIWGNFGKVWLAGSEKLKYWGGGNFKLNDLNVPF